MGTAERRAREKDEKRRAILAAAVRCFGRKGYDATTLDEIGAAAEVAKGTLYLYFRNKADLFATLLLDHGFDIFARALRERVRPGAKPDAAVRDFARCFRELCLEGRKEIFELFLQLDRGDIAADLSPELRREARSRLESLLSLIASVVDPGRGRRAALLLWAFCVGIAHLSKGGYVDAHGALEDGVSILIRGLKLGERHGRRR